MTTAILLAVGLSGASWYANRSARAILDHERSQFIRIMHNRLEERGHALGEVATILASLDGPVGDRLKAWTHVPVDVAAVFDPRTGKSRSHRGPELDAADVRVALARRRQAAASGPPLVRSGGGVYLAAFEYGDHGDAVGVADRLDIAFARDLERLLGGRILVESRGPAPAAGPDELVATLELATVGGAPARISLVLPARDLALARHEAIRAAAVVGALLLLASVGFSAWTMARVTRPVTRLIDAAQRVADGRLDTRIPANAPAELGRLIRAFNEMAQRLSQAEDRIVRASKLSALGTVVAGISHELNNPLSVILSHAELSLDRTPAGAPGREALEIVLAEGGRMKRILAELRGLLRAADPVRARIDVRRLVADVHRLIAPEAAKAHVTSEVDPAGDESHVEASPDEVRQVILNLALNALQAMPDGGRLRLAVGTASVDGNRVARITVEDTGEGLSPERCAVVFEPFHSTRPGRLGLGLAISRDIARRHGGDVRLLPRTGGGTAALLDLPAAAS